MIKSFLTMDHFGDLILVLFFVAVIPAIGEELLFRGTLQHKLQRIINPHLAIIVISFFFAFIHLQFLSFLPRFLLGMMLGYLFYQSRNLYMPILAHFLHNSFAVLTVYMYPNMIEESPELEIQMTLVIFSFLISGALFYSYYSLNRYILNRR